VVGKEGMVGMCAEGDGNGAFVVAELCEALMGGSEGERERKEVKRWFTESEEGDWGGKGKGEESVFGKNYAFVIGLIGESILGYALFQLS